MSPTPFLLDFAPERWGEAEKFRKLGMHGPHSSRLRLAVNGVVGHFDKVQTLLDLVKDILPTVDKDEAELKEMGFTAAKQSKKVATLIEALFTELYAVLDCARQVVNEKFGNLRGANAGRTYGLVTHARNGTIDERVPEAIRRAWALGPWYDRLRTLRDDVAHADVGTCHRNGTEITYFPARRGPQGQSRHIDNVVAAVLEFRDAINHVLGQTFQALSQALPAAETEAACGLHERRVFVRYVVPSQVTSRHSGRCKSHEWFDLPENLAHRCPLADGCGAYAARRVAEARAAPGF